MTKALAILLFLLFLGSCIKEEVSDNAIPLTPEYSLPIGSIESSFHFPPLNADSTHPGNFGFISVDGRTYPNPQQYYSSQDQLPLDFKNSFTNSDNIISLTFKVIVTNSYPTQFFAQLYFLGNGGYVLDSLLRSGMAVINAAEYNQDRKLTKESIQVFNIPLDSIQIRNLTRSKAMGVAAMLKSTGPNGEKLYITSQQQLTFDMGMRIKMKIN